MIPFSSILLQAVLVLYFVKEVTGVIRLTWFSDRCTISLHTSKNNRVWRRIAIIIVDLKKTVVLIALWFYSQIAHRFFHQIFSLVVLDFNQRRNRSRMSERFNIRDGHNTNWTVETINNGLGIGVVRHFNLFSKARQVLFIEIFSIHPHRVVVFEPFLSPLRSPSLFPLEKKM